MKKRRIVTRSLLCLLLTACLLFTGCTYLSDEKIKLRDLDFTVLSEEMIPEELKGIIEEKKNMRKYQPSWTGDERQEQQDALLPGNRTEDGVSGADRDL